jgi:putative acetyltransferase|tara:strand:+ start:661 stop:972 length:312 start_codon:yes stop_codon:yes gene_type:complete
LENANKIAHPFLSKSFVDQLRHDIPNLYLPTADTWVTDLDDKTVGFIAIIGNDVGTIFVEPALQGIVVARTLIDKAYSLHTTLEVEVFKENSIGRKFYSAYGF